MYQDVQITDYLEIVYQKLAKGGVFLTAQNQSSLNTMTIGWGGITHFWAKPIFIVPVRRSRYTYDLIDSAGEFTVSVPLEADLSAQLRFCGTHSGRDVDKFQSAGITAVPGQVISTPVIAQCELHFECKTVYKQTMDPAFLDAAVQERWYPDYHTLYFGEIVACYRIDGVK
ncbi:MAG: flavin reductase family protein [Candidatus Wallacebacter cryptica]|jgi:flavin reductase (DIM6/NTAB) family NADH-FMN oxidoreductase RutF|nr:flavin reductase family protein [Bacillota bacterium]